MEISKTKNEIQITYENVDEIYNLICHVKNESPENLIGLSDYVEEKTNNDLGLVVIRKDNIDYTAFFISEKEIFSFLEKEFPGYVFDELTYERDEVGMDIYGGIK